MHENLDVLGLAILPVCPSYLTPHTNVVSKAKGIVSEVADDILAHNFILNYKKICHYLFVCMFVFDEDESLFMLFLYAKDFLAVYHITELELDDAGSLFLQLI